MALHRRSLQLLLTERGYVCCNAWLLLGGQRSKHDQQVQELRSCKMGKA